MVKKRYRKAVFVVTYRRGRNIFGKSGIFYLILKRKMHWIGWEFPKGGINKKESLTSAVKREIKEETGQKAVKINNHNTSGKYKYTNELNDRPEIIGQTYKLYSAELKNKKIRLDKKEHSSYKWMSFKKALNKLTNLNQKKCLKIVDKSIKNY